MIEQVRVSAARRLLGLGREAPKKVAVDCGFAQRRGLLRVKCGSGAKRSSGSAGHPTRDTITAAQNPVKLCTGHSVNLKTGAPHVGCVADRGGSDLAFAPGFATLLPEKKTSPLPRPNFRGTRFRRACYSGLMPASQPHFDASHAYRLTTGTQIGHYAAGVWSFNERNCCRPRGVTF